MKAVVGKVISLTDSPSSTTRANSLLIVGTILKLQPQHLKSLYKCLEERLYDNTHAVQKRAFQTFSSLKTLDVKTHHKLCLAMVEAALMSEHPELISL